MVKCFIACENVNVRYNQKDIFLFVDSVLATLSHSDHLKKNDSVADLVWRNNVVYLLETNWGGAYRGPIRLLRGNNTFQNLGDYQVSKHSLRLHMPVLRGCEQHICITRRCFASNECGGQWRSRKSERYCARPITAQTVNKPHRW